MLNRGVSQLICKSALLLLKLFVGIVGAAVGAVAAALMRKRTPAAVAVVAS